MISYDYFFDDPPPQGADFIYFWLKTHFHFPEGNFCVRKNVIDDCFPLFDPQHVEEENGFLSFNYNFNTQGYLPFFIPVVANYGRIHQDAGGQRQMASGQMKKWIERYHNDIDKYINNLFKGRMIHRFKDGFANIISEEFDINKSKNNKINRQFNRKWYHNVIKMVLG